MSTTTTGSSGMSAVMKKEVKKRPLKYSKPLEVKRVKRK